jgi:hypothetical protein
MYLHRNAQRVPYVIILFYRVYISIDTIGNHMLHTGQPLYKADVGSHTFAPCYK